MSVLYKALARAAKARQSVRPDAGFVPAPAVFTTRPRRRVRPWFLIAGAFVAAGLASFLLFGDELADDLDIIVTELLGGETPPPPPVPRPHPAVSKPVPGAPQPAATATASAPPAGAPAAPANPAATPANPAMAPAPPQAAAATPPPTANAPPQPEAAGAPVPVTSAATPTQPAQPAAPAPQPSQVVAAPASPPAGSEAASAAPAASEAEEQPASDGPLPVDRSASSTLSFKPAQEAAGATEAARAPAKLAQAQIAPDQNLPAVLDRLRAQHARDSAVSSAVIDRGEDKASAADGMVAVSTSTPGDRDATERAYDLLLHGQYEGALQLYDAVLKNEPNSLPALQGKATALHKLRRYAEARTYYQRVLAIDPGNREALTNMMAIIAAQSPTQALHELHDLQKTYPAFSPIAAEIAEVEAQSGNLAEAIGEFNRAITLSPENGLYRLNLAILQDRAGMVHEAAASYQLALDLLGNATQLPIPVDTIRARLRYLRTR